MKLVKNLLIGSFACAALAACTTMNTEKSLPLPPPVNPHLAQSNHAMGHATPAQQGSFLVAGPRNESRKLADDEIQYAKVGMLHLAGLISSPYADGSRVIWSNGVDRIVKLDYDSYQPLAEYPLPGRRKLDDSEGETLIRQLDTLEGKAQMQAAFHAAGTMLGNMAGTYTLLDSNNRFYAASADGNISVYGDADPAHCSSAIKIVAQFSLPSTVKGSAIGMNMTYDGWLIFATTQGYVVAVSPDYQRFEVTQLRHSDNAGANSDESFGWIRNGFAVDADGGIYIVSNDHMHKVVWTGKRLSVDPRDNAWVAPYRNATGRGSGSTPSLMGFGDEDRFVVINDGDEVMNLTLFWRDAIPADWQQLPGAPSHRIAGYLPVNMGNPELKSAQSEQSVAVAGYGALVPNNTPRNVPPQFKGRAAFMVVGFMGNVPAYQPYGVQKFVWDPEARQLKNAWVNTDVSAPNNVPTVSLRGNTSYFIGARDGNWTLEALDWQTGEEVFHYILGGAKYDSFGSGTLIDHEGRIHYGTLWGRMRLNPKNHQ